MSYEGAGKAVGHEDRRRVALAHVAIERGKPVGQARLQPIALDDAPARGIGALPAALPMVGLRIGVSGQDQNRRGIHEAQSKRDGQPLWQQINNRDSD